NVWGLLVAVLPPPHGTEPSLGAVLVVQSYGVAQIVAADSDVRGGRLIVAGLTGQQIGRKVAGRGQAGRQQVLVDGDVVHGPLVEIDRADGGPALGGIIPVEADILPPRVQ